MSKRGSIKQFLKQTSAVKGALAVTCDDDGSALIPFLHVQLKRGLYILKCNFRCGPTEGVTKRENANMSLPVSWCKIRPAPKNADA